MDATDATDEKGPARGSRPCRADIEDTNTTDYTDDDTGFQRIGAVAGWVVARVARRCDLPIPTAELVATLAGMIGGAR